MKKVYLLLVLLLIFNCISLVACDTTADSGTKIDGEVEKKDTTQSSTNDYTITILSGAESDIFKSDYLYSDNSYERTIETLSNTPISTLKLGDTEVKAYKTEIVHMSSGEKISVFLSEDDNIEYRISSTGNWFTISAKNESVLFSHVGDNVSETSMIKTINDYIPSIVEMSDIATYAVDCRTSVVVTSLDSAWRETKEGYYVVPENLLSTQKVINYQFRFEKYCNNYKTSDSIIVTCSPAGDVISMSYSDFDVDWSGFTVDEEKINRMVNTYLTNAIVNEYQLKNYRLDESVLVYRDNQIKLSLTYELTLVKDNYEIVVLCPVMVAIK